VNFSIEVMEVNMMLKNSGFLILFTVLAVASNIEASDTQKRVTRGGDKTRVVTVDTNTATTPKAPRAKKAKKDTNLAVAADNEAASGTASNRTTTQDEFEQEFQDAVANTPPAANENFLEDFDFNLDDNPLSPAEIANALGLDPVLVQDAPVLVQDAPVLVQDAPVLVQDAPVLVQAPTVVPAPVIAPVDADAIRRAQVRRAEEKASKRNAESLALVSHADRGDLVWFKKEHLASQIGYLQSKVRYNAPAEIVLDLAINNSKDSMAVATQLVITALESGNMDSYENLIEHANVYAPYRNKAILFFANTQLHANTELFESFVNRALAQEKAENNAATKAIFNTTLNNLAFNTVSENGANLRVLLQHDIFANATQGRNFQTLAHAAVIAKNSDALREMNAALLNKADRNGKTPLHYAAASDIRMFRLLMDNLDVDAHAVDAARLPAFAYITDDGLRASLIAAYQEKLGDTVDADVQYSLTQKAKKAAGCAVQ